MSHKVRGENPIDFSSDILDARELDERLEYLSNTREELEEKAKEREDGLEMEGHDIEVWTTKDGTVLAESDEYGEDEESEYKILKDAENEWDSRNEPTLVNEDYFTKYAEQLAEDLGYMNNANRWPYTCIDWEKAADELRSDYTSIELDGHTFLFRA